MYKYFHRLIIYFYFVFFFIPITELVHSYQKQILLTSIPKFAFRAIRTDNGFKFVVL